MNTYMRYLMTMLCALFICALSLRADEPNPDIALFNINYDYTITNEEYGIDCEGELSFSLNIPKGTSLIVLSKGMTHKGSDWDSYKRHIYRTKRIIDFNKSQTIINYNYPYPINWGSFFRITYSLEDGSHLETNEYNVNSYISPSDLEMLQNYASIDSPEQDSYDISYNPNTKELEVSDNANIEIYDLTGCKLFEGLVSGSYSLAYIRSKFIIVRCTIKNQVIIKKIIL